MESVVSKQLRRLRWLHDRARGTKGGTQCGEKTRVRSGGNQMNPPETAPKDGSSFLGDFGWPWLLMAIWNESDEHFCVCYPQACELANGTIDNYFEVEWESEKDLKGWLPIPRKESK